MSVPTLKVETFFSDILKIEDGKNTPSRNEGNDLPTDAEQHSGKSKTSTFVFCKRADLLAS